MFARVGFVLRMVLEEQSCSCPNQGFILGTMTGLELVRLSLFSDWGPSSVLICTLSALAAFGCLTLVSRLNVSIQQGKHCLWRENDCNKKPWFKVQHSGWLKVCIMLEEKFHQEPARHRGDINFFFGN